MSLEKVTPVYTCDPVSAGLTASKCRRSSTQSTDAVKGIENDKILLVEDYEINMEIARFVLENEGAQVQEAWNGKEAVDLFAASRTGWI